MQGGVKGDGMGTGLGIRGTGKESEIAKMEER
jgi:hypothetical protein